MSAELAPAWGTKPVQLRLFECVTQRLDVVQTGVAWPQHDRQESPCLVVTGPTGVGQLAGTCRMSDVISPRAPLVRACSRSATVETGHMITGL